MCTIGFPILHRFHRCVNAGVPVGPRKLLPSNMRDGSDLAVVYPKTCMTALIRHMWCVQLAFVGFIVQAQATGKGPIACLSEHLGSPMTTTLVSRGLVTPTTVISPGCAINPVTVFQGISIPTPCLPLWP